MVFQLIKGVLGRKAASAAAPAATSPVAVEPRPDEALAVAQARVHLDAAQLAQARALLEPYAQTSHRLETLLWLSRIRVSQGEVDAALQLLERARTLHPAATELIETAAVAHEMKRQPVQALECWQKLVFATPTPPAQVCVNWMRAFVRAAKERPPRHGEVVTRVAALLDRAPDVEPAHRMAFSEWLYATKPHVDLAVARYREASPPGDDERDVSATWSSLSAWCDRSGARLHSGRPLGDTAPPVSVAELRDVRVIPGFQWIPVLQEGTVALSGFTMHRMKPRRETLRSPQLMNNRERLELRLARSPRVVDTPALLIGGMPQYYHHTIDFLSALAVAEALGVGDGLPLVVNDDLAPFQREQLRLLGVGDDRLVRVAEDEQVLFRSLLVPTRLVLGGQWMHPLIHRWYRERFAALVPAGQPPRKLYVSRRLAPRRRISNEAEVEAALATRGYQTVHPEELDVMQQITLCSSATHLVAPVGAALTNMVFMPPGGSLLVPVSRYAVAGPGDTYFDALATACGHRFAWLTGRPVVFGGERVIDADFEVDIDELTRALDAGG